MIESWLKKFIDAWKGHDIDAVMALFAPTVEYWESPFKKFDLLEEIRAEWATIEQQKDIDVQTKVVLSEKDLHTIQWDLSYRLSETIHNWAGLYILKLEDSGQCSYFYQVGEEKK